MIKIWLPSFLISTAILGSLFYFDRKTSLDLAGNPIAALIVGALETMVLFMPFYGVAGYLRGRLGWPEWTPLLMVGMMWLSVNFAFYFFANSDSGINSWRVVFHATSVLLVGSLAYGLPSVVLTYARKRNSSIGMGV